MKSHVTTHTLKEIGHNFPNRMRAFIGIWVRHQGNDEFILAAKMPRMTQKIGGKIPPPNRSIAIARSIMTSPLFFRWTKRVVQMRKMREKKTARIPVMRRLGKMVMAGSPAWMRKKSEPGQDNIIIPSGTVFPWRSSPIPCSIPARAIIVPNVVTNTFVAFFILI